MDMSVGPLPDHAGESPLLSRSGGEKGLRGSGAGTLGVHSKFAGILCAALSQHHLSGFEIAKLEFHYLAIAFSDNRIVRPN